MNKFGVTWTCVISIIIIIIINMYGDDDDVVIFLFLFWTRKMKRVEACSDVCVRHIKFGQLCDNHKLLFFLSSLFYIRIRSLFRQFISIILIWNKRYLSFFSSLSSLRGVLISFTNVYVCMTTFKMLSMWRNEIGEREGEKQRERAREYHNYYYWTTTENGLDFGLNAIF